MLTVLFWNIQKKQLLDRVARIVRAHAVDVVVLAECVQTDPELLAALNAGGRRFACPRRFTDKFRIAFASPPETLNVHYDDPSESLSMCELTFRRKQPLTFALVHLPSKLSPRDSVVERVAEDFRHQERARGHQRTVIFGDFNRSPFDDVMVDALGFHALMTRELTGRRHERTVSGVEYPALFNPMWQFLTDRKGVQPGSYYFHDSRPLNHFWYTLDQVLVRPELMDKIGKVSILATDGTDSLLDGTNGWPDAAGGSDHLPLLFRLNW